MNTQDPPPEAYWVSAVIVVVLPAIALAALGKWGFALLCFCLCLVIECVVGWASPEQLPIQKLVGRRGAGPWPTGKHRRQFAGLLLFIAVVSTLSIAYQLVSGGMTVMLGLQIVATILPLAAGLAMMKQL